MIGDLGVEDREGFMTVLAADAGESSEGRTPALNAPVRIRLRAIGSQGISAFKLHCSGVSHDQLGRNCR